MLSDSVSLKQYLLVQVHHTKKKLAASPASLKAFTAFPLHLPQLCCLAIFINMYNEKSHGCVRAIQYFHGCPTSPFCHNKFLIYAANYCHHVAKELIHTVDTVSSTFRLSDLYIKTLLFDRQTEIWFYLICGGIKHISNTIYSETDFNSPHFRFNLPGIGFCLLLLTQCVKKTESVNSCWNNMLEKLRSYKWKHWPKNPLKNIPPNPNQHPNAYLWCVKDLSLNLC